jgi:hypothetical protein
MEVMASHELATAGINLLQQSLPLLLITCPSSTDIFSHLCFLLPSPYWVLLTGFDPWVVTILLWGFFWLGRLDGPRVEEEMFGADVAVVSALDDVPDFEASGDPLELVEDDFSAFEEFFEVEMKLIPIESVVFTEVLFADGEEGRDSVDDCVHSFVGPGCSGPPLLFF